MKINSFEAYLAIHSDYLIEGIDSESGVEIIDLQNQHAWPRMSLYCFSTANTVDSKSNSVQLDTKDKKEVHALLMEYLKDTEDAN